jgi:hypothetical protein
MVVAVIMVAVGVVVGAIVSPGFRKVLGVVVAVLVALGGVAALSERERTERTSFDPEGYRPPSPFPSTPRAVAPPSIPPLGTHACGDCGLPHNLDPSVQYVTANAKREVRRSQHLCSRCGRLHSVSVWS